MITLQIDIYLVDSLKSEGDFAAARLACCTGGGDDDDYQECLSLSSSSSLFSRSIMEEINLTPLSLLLTLRRQWMSEREKRQTKKDSRGWHVDGRAQEEEEEVKEARDTERERERGRGEVTTGKIKKENWEAPV